MPKLALLSLSLLASALTSLNAEPAPSAPATNAIESAWQTTALGLFKEANSEFEAQKSDEARLGEAVSLLLRQPKTEGNVDRAATLLTALIQHSPQSDLAISARYYLGRIEQTHRASPNLAEARKIFRALIAAHPDNPYADLATVKLAIIELYEDLPADERRARFDAFSALVSALKFPSARRDLAMLLADTAQRFGYDPKLALDLLLVADQVGIARRAEQGNTWVRIGQLAADAGRFEVARAYYEKYLAIFIRDNRRRMVAERLAALPLQASAQQTAR